MKGPESLAATTSILAERKHRQPRSAAQGAVNFLAHMIEAYHRTEALRQGGFIGRILIRPYTERAYATPPGALFWLGAFVP